MLSNIFAPLAVKVSAGIIALLVIALVVVTARADAISSEREVLRNRLANAEARHAVTKASLEQMTNDLSRIVYEGATREDRVQQALDEQQERSAVLREEAAKIIAESVTDPCKTPQSVLQAKGL